MSDQTDRPGQPQPPTESLLPDERAFLRILRQNLVSESPDFARRALDHVVNALGDVVGQRVVRATGRDAVRRAIGHMDSASNDPIVFPPTPINPGVGPLDPWIPPIPVPAPDPWPDPPDTPIFPVPNRPDPFGPFGPQEPEPPSEPVPIDPAVPGPEPDETGGFTEGTDLGGGAESAQG